MTAITFFKFQTPQFPAQAMAFRGSIDQRTETMTPNSISILHFLANCQNPISPGISQVVSQPPVSVLARIEQEPSFHQQGIPSSLLPGNFIDIHAGNWLALYWSR
jgi:hypothetical protein